MVLVNPVLVTLKLQKFVVKTEGLFQNGLMSLGVGSSTVSLNIKHTVFAVSYLDRGRRKKLDMMHLLKMVGQVGIKNID
jgi:hypothetical protein